MFSAAERGSVGAVAPLGLLPHRWAREVDAVGGRDF